MSLLSTFCVTLTRFCVTFTQFCVTFTQKHRESIPTHTVSGEAP